MVFVTVYGNLTAFSASTGARLYSVVVCQGNDAAAAPLVSGAVVVSSCRSGARVTASNATSGAPIWATSVSGSSNDIWGPPALITYNFRTIVVFATIGGAISGYDLLMGSHVVTLNSAGGGVSVSGGQGRGAVVVANSGSVVYAAFDLVAPSSARPAAIVGLDVSNGATTMTATTPGGGYIGRGSMALSSTGVLYTYVNEGARVAAVSTTANSTVLWTFRMNDQESYRDIYSGPLVAPDGSVFVRDDRALGGARLYVLDGATGVQKWNYSLPGGCVRNSPIIAHGGLYVAGYSTVLKLVDVSASVTPAPSATPSNLPSATMAASSAAPVPSPSQAAASGAPMPFVARVIMTLRINGLNSGPINQDFGKENVLFVSCSQTAEPLQSNGVATGGLPDVMLHAYLCCRPGCPPVLATYIINRSVRCLSARAQLSFPLLFAHGLRYRFWLLLLLSDHGCRTR